MTAMQRFNHRAPCPICGGYDDAPRGEGVRCFGFLSADGQWAHCTRPDHAGSLAVNPNSETYAHRLVGECQCGQQHESSPAAANVRPFTPRPRKRIVATYDYRNADGSLLFQVVRQDPKAFLQRRPDGKGDWIWNLQGLPHLVLYRYPELLAQPSEAVWIAEREKDADNLAALGFVATTNAMGAKKWRPEYTEALRGRHVFLLRDADDEGARHVAKVAAALHGVAATVTVLPPFVVDGIKGSDVSDWLAAGGTREDLDELAANAPLWEPSDATSEPTSDHVNDIDAVTTFLTTAENTTTAIAETLARPEMIASLVRLRADDPAGYAALLMTLEQSARAKDVKALDRAVIATEKRYRASRGRMSADPDLVRVLAVLDDAPVSNAALVPRGWLLGSQAVAREHLSTDETGAQKTATEVIAPAPMVITGRLANVNDGTEAVRLGWKRDNIWRQATVNRDVIANARELVKVSGLGLPVTSGTSGDIVKYLADYEAVNLSGLPRARVSHQLGWQGNQGSEGFLWGQSLIRPDGAEMATIDLDAVAPSDWREDWLAYRGEDAGDDQLVAGYTAVGSFDDWRAAVAEVATFPSVLIALYAGLAAPLLEILGCQNFVVDWSHMTSTGKTTVLRLAASAWGSPDERAAATAIQTWDVTNVWIERAAATIHSLPLILDDTKRARKAELVAKTIYDIVSGRGRGRGSPLGTRRMLTWRTVLLSSGEQRITDFSQDGGTRPRVLELWGVPFGKTDQATARIVQRLNLTLFQHYGHAGPRFIQYLLTHRDQWDAWRAQTRKTQEAFLERAADNPFAGRIAEPMAVLTMAEALACAALDLPWGFRDTASGLWEALAGEASEADRAAHALEYVMSWAVGHQKHFYGRGTGEPTTGWVGRWDAAWEWIGFLPDRIKAVLTDGEFEPESTIRLWRDREWLALMPDGRRMQSRVGDVSHRLVAIRRAAFDGEIADVEA